LPRRIDPAIGLRGANAYRGRDQEDRRDGQRGQGQEPLATTPTQRERRPGQKERDVAPQPAGKLQQLVARHGVPGEPVHRDQSGRGIAGAAAKTATHGNALLESQVDAEPMAGGLQHHGGGADGEVLLRRPQVRASHLDGNVPPVAAFHD
jgi:hypothetical protein